MRIRVGILAASPVYYQAPLYRRVAADPRVDLTVIFCSDQGAYRRWDNEYGHAVEWGVNPLEGYRFVFLSRAGSNPTGGKTFALRDYDIVPVILKNDFDVLWLHGYHTVTHLLAAVTQKLRRRPLLYREEQTLLTPRPHWKTAIKKVGLTPLFRGSYGLFLGGENRRWFEHWGVPSDYLFHVPYAADTAALKAGAPATRGEARASFGIGPEGGPVVAVVGRLMAKKQPLVALDAFARTRARQQCSLLIVGSGALEGQLRDEVKSRGIPDVVFAGFLDQREIGRAYRAADVLVLASAYDETWGLVVNEAMGFGIPALVSDRVGCGVDLVLSETTGLRFEYDRPDHLADQLSRIVSDEKLRSDMGRNAAQHIMSWNYDAALAGALRALKAAVGSTRWQDACSG